jgi:hypothetical protein
MMDESIIVSVDFINGIMTIPFNNQEARNKNSILRSLKSLIKKEVFIIENDIDVDDIKKNTIIKLTINDKKLSNTDVRDGKFKNFAKLGFVEFTKFKNSKECFIYYVVKKWDQGAIYSYGQWAETLQCSVASAKRYIKGVVDNKIIYVIIGAHTSELVAGRNQKKQEANTYSIKPFSKFEEVEAEDYEATEFVKDKKAEKAITEQLNVIEQTEKDGHNWHVKAELTVDDFVVYLTTDDEDLKKTAKKRIDIISKTEKGKYVMDDLMSKAKEQLKKEKEKLEKKRFNDLEAVAKDIVDETGDIVLLVDGDLVKYSDYKAGMKVDKVFYYQLKDLYEDEALIFESKSNPYNIENYRKDSNDQWQQFIFDEEPYFNDSFGEIEESEFEKFESSYQKKEDSSDISEL